MKRNRFGNGRGRGKGDKKGDNGVFSLIHAVKSPAPSTIFIRLMEPIDPVTMVMQILTDNVKSGTKTSRFIQRLIPAQESCACSTADFERTFRSYFDSFLASQGGSAKGDDDKKIEKVSKIWLLKYYSYCLIKMTLTICLLQLNSIHPSFYDD